MEYTCKYCNVKYIKYNSLWKHIKIKHDSKMTKSGGMVAKSGENMEINNIPQTSNQTFINKYQKKI